MSHQERRKISKEERPKIIASLGQAFYNLTRSTENEELDEVVMNPNRTVLQNKEDPTRFVAITVLPQIPPYTDRLTTEKIRHMLPVSQKLIDQLPNGFSYPILYVEIYTGTEGANEPTPETDEVELISTPFKKEPIPSQVVSPEGKKYRIYNAYLLNIFGEGMRVVDASRLENGQGNDAYYLDVYPADPLEVLGPMKPFDIKKLTGVMKDIEEAKYAEIRLP